MTAIAVDNFDSPRQHRFSGGEQWIVPARDSVSRCEETHKRCARCRIVKITIHASQGFPNRAWQHENGERWIGDRAPPCVESRPREVPIQ